MMARSDEPFCLHVLARNEIDRWIAAFIYWLVGVIGGWILAYFRVLRWLRKRYSLRQVASKEFWADFGDVRPDERAAVLLDEIESLCSIFQSSGRFAKSGQNCSKEAAPAGIIELLSIRRRRLWQRSRSKRRVKPARCPRPAQSSCPGGRAPRPRGAANRRCRRRHGWRRPPTSPPAHRSAWSSPRAG